MLVRRVVAELAGGDWEVEWTSLAVTNRVQFGVHAALGAVEQASAPRFLTPNWSRYGGPSGRWRRSLRSSLLQRGRPLSGRRHLCFSTASNSFRGPCVVHTPKERRAISTHCDKMNNPNHFVPVIGARFGMRFRKEGLQTRRLRVCQLQI